ncbi:MULTISPECIES: mechanosensitive ion channel family protein [Caballeronia]|jgi:small-conductance mechanosensitive channel|uniref:mechanosensitive ion channel family protein n=1 Tax=Caballeronia TaxID=1827195 RepID=UPI0004595C82|nr:MULTISPECIES: mechanosensitive ion channel domain-containing protein [Caballeronia]KAK48547.1 mechanosensitive ion channel protein MscS [Caballeronia jiangsuensis]MBC8641133.1 mechanosensitive ion channel [Caballeronia sp. EK]GJH07769.1 mechanosensitive ion channel [Caballeronia novacaledonica]
MDSIDRLRPAYDSFTAIAVTYGIDILLALLILAVGWWISNTVANAMRRALARTNVDATLTPVLASLAMWAIRVVAIVAALGKFGIAAASILTVLGAAGLAIGLALQGTLQNIAAGLMLLLLRPFRVGDYIEGVGTTAGTVNEIGLFTTRLTKADGIVMFVPNSLIWANAITNYSANDRRRVVINFQAQHGLKVEHVLAELRSLMSEDSRIVQDGPSAPWVAVTDYTDTGVKYNLGAWTNRSDHQYVMADLLRKIQPYTREEAQAA